MIAGMDRAAERGFPGVRLVRAAFHGRSMSLYARLGFDIREPLVVMQGPPIRKAPSGYSVRPAVAEDLEECNALCRRVHGHDRSQELSDAIARGMARVAECNGRVGAYASAVGFFGHSVAQRNRDLQAHSWVASTNSRTWFSPPDSQHEALPLVLKSWASRCRAHDAVDRRPIQRARWGVSPVDTLSDVRNFYSPPLTFVA